MWILGVISSQNWVCGETEAQKENGIAQRHTTNQQHFQDDGSFPSRTHSPNRPFNNYWTDCALSTFLDAGDK